MIFAGWTFIMGWALAVSAAPLGGEGTPAQGVFAVSTGSGGHLAPVAVPDTVPLPREWPAAFPQPPAGAAVAGVTPVEAADRAADRPGPYFIVAIDLPGTEQEGFAHYREALVESEWEILEGLTNDGSRPGLVTIGFRGHGHAGDIRFQEVLGSVLATIHLYREEGAP